MARAVAGSLAVVLLLAAVGARVKAQAEARAPTHAVAQAEARAEARAEAPAAETPALAPASAQKSAPARPAAAQAEAQALASALAPAFRRGSPPSDQTLAGLIPGPVRETLLQKGLWGHLEAKSLSHVRHKVSAFLRAKPFVELRLGGAGDPQGFSEWTSEGVAVAPRKSPRSLKVQLVHLGRAMRQALGKWWESQPTPRHPNDDFSLRLELSSDVAATLGSGGLVLSDHGREFAWATGAGSVSIGDSSERLAHAEAALVGRAPGVGRHSDDEALVRRVLEHYRTPQSVRWAILEAAEPVEQASGTGTLQVGDDLGGLGVALGAPSASKG